MPTLPERFFDARSAAMTKLREFGAARGNLNQGAARACNGTSQMLYQHPWGTKAHAASILFLPRLVGNLFQDDGVAHPHDLMDHATMQALAMGCELAFFGGLAPPGGLVAHALFPVQPLLASLLRTPLFIVVLRIRCPSLPVHLALHAPDGVL